VLKHGTASGRAGVEYPRSRCADTRARFGDSRERMDDPEARRRAGVNAPGPQHYGRTQRT
jgi:hypothetical protein